MQKKANLLTIALIISLLSWNLDANTVDLKQTLKISELTGEIKNYVQEKLVEQYEGEIVTELLQQNSDLQLKQCDMPIDYALPEHAVLTNTTTVKVSCPGTNPWTIYMSLKIKIYQPVLVTNRPMSRDEIITADVVSLKKVDITSLTQGFFSDPMLVIGQIMRFPVKAGNVLTPTSVAKNKLIKRGERVSINVEDPEILVYMQGEALEDGAFGDKVKIRNLSSKRIVEATIVAPGKVQIQI